MRRQAIRPRLFWDTSALIDAIFAVDDWPYVDLFQLGEADAVDMRISPDVLRECHGVLGRYGEIERSRLDIALSEANFATTPEPAEETVQYCLELTGYRSDARILAAAEECAADILVTHDKQHFLGNPLVSPPETHCLAMTADEAMVWCVQIILAANESALEED